MWDVHISFSGRPSASMFLDLECVWACFLPPAIAAVAAARWLMSTLSTYLFHTGELCISFSVGKTHVSRLLCYSLSLLFLLLASFQRVIYSVINGEWIVVKLQFPELLGGVHLCSGVGGGPPGSCELWKQRASLVTDALAWNESLIKALPLCRYPLVDTVKNKTVSLWSVLTFTY